MGVTHSLGKVEIKKCGPSLWACKVEAKTVRSNNPSVVLERNLKEVEFETQRKGRRWGLNAENSSKSSCARQSAGGIA